MSEEREKQGRASEGKKGAEGEREGSWMEEKRARD